MPKPLTRKDTSASTSDNVCSTPSVSDTILELFQNDTFLKKIHDIVRTIAHEVAETSFAKVNELIERNEGRLHEVEVKVEERKHRLEELEEEIDMKENRILKLEMAANDLQQYSRRSSLRIFGVPEKEKEDTDQIVCDIVSSKLGIPITRNDIDRSHRTGKHTRDTRSKHRSIIAKFCTYRKRTEIIRSRKKTQRIRNHNPRRSHTSECGTLHQNIQRPEGQSCLDTRRQDHCFDPSNRREDNDQNDKL